MAYELPRKLMGSGDVIFDDKRRVLLVKHSYGKLNWEIPGGCSEPNESVIETAIREVKEETGLSVSVDRLTGIYYDPDFDMHHFAFVCTPLDDTSPQPDLGEITECTYWSIDELPRPISDFTVSRIMDALEAANNMAVFPKIIGPRKWIE
jgi:ADP-ribose pyrophosphatase YjhB (NUDIX family)